MVNSLKKKKKTMAEEKVLHLSKKASAYVDWLIYSNAAISVA